MRLRVLVLAFAVAVAALGLAACHGITGSSAADVDTVETADSPMADLGNVLESVSTGHGSLGDPLLGLGP